MWFPKRCICRWIIVSERVELVLDTELNPHHVNIESSYENFEVGSSESYWKQSCELKCQKLNKMSQRGLPLQHFSGYRASALSGRMPREYVACMRIWIHSSVSNLNARKMAVHWYIDIILVLLTCNLHLALGWWFVWGYLIPIANEPRASIVWTINRSIQFLIHVTDKVYYFVTP
jgi:hypothetical protein